MRCTACNVDLAETYTKCPLCGAAAVDEPAKITAFRVAPYPHGDTKPPVVETVKTHYSLSRERLKAFFNL